jgi:hypothetical protein
LLLRVLFAKTRPHTVISTFSLTFSHLQMPLASVATLINLARHKTDSEVCVSGCSNTHHRHQPFNSGPGLCRTPLPLVPSSQFMYLAPRCNTFGSLGGCRPHPARLRKFPSFQISTARDRILTGQRLPTLPPALYTISST